MSAICALKASRSKIPPQFVPTLLEALEAVAELDHLIGKRLRRHNGK
jgi:hypothetical protein